MPLPPMARTTTTTKTAPEEVPPPRKSRRIPPNLKKNIAVMVRLSELQEIVAALDESAPLKHRLRAQLLEEQARIDDEMAAEQAA